MSVTSSSDLSVTVIVPLYNKGSYICETIESVKKQTHNVWELLVANNGSSDDGPDIAYSLEKNCTRIRLLESPQQGPGAARNFGVREARGDWVLFLDADDTIEPHHLERLLDVGNEHPQATVVAGGWKEFVDGRPDEFVIKRPASEESPERLVDRAIATSPWAVHAAIVRRELALQHPWPEHMDGLLAEDNAFWFSICLHGQLAFSDSAGALYRTQTPSCRSQSHDIRKFYAGVSTAVDENIAALASLGRTPNPEQAATLMRFFSGVYNQAVQDGDKQIAALSAEKATEWLNHCDISSRSIAVRKLMGIRLFEKSRRLIG